MTPTQEATIVTVVEALLAYWQERDGIPVDENVIDQLVTEIGALIEAGFYQRLKAAMHLRRIFCITGGGHAPSHP
jgi:hypothetical protein